MDIVASASKKVQKAQKAFDSNPCRQTKTEYYAAYDQLLNLIELQRRDYIRLWIKRAQINKIKRETE
jgi:hypothetical protein